MARKFKYEVGIIGAGVMGTAIANGLISSKSISKSTIWFGTRSGTLESPDGILRSSDYESLVAKTKTIIVCVKPKQVEGIVKKLCDAGISSDQILVSIAAGVSIEKLESWLQDKSVPVVRAMPNTPVIVRQGVTVFSVGKNVSPANSKIVEKIFSSIGLCIKVEEEHFNALTGLGGSGPAYCYLVMESLIDGGVRVGLPRELAKEVVLQTVIGSAEMVKQTGKHPAKLKDEVTTPAGCTIGALLTMEDGKIRSVLARAVEEAARIAGKLS